MSWEAKYPGRCEDCGEPIDKGDQIDRGDVGGYVHADCEESGAAAAEPTPEPCRRCHMVPAANGACGCDD